MWINRKLENQILKIVNFMPSVYLSGPRQVGKTSLVRKIFPDFSYISFDLPSIAERAEKNPDLFFGQIKENVILDEIQYVPSLFRYLKYEIDSQKGKKFILTGSQKFLMIKNITDSLAGRCAIIDLLGLSYFEIKEKVEENVSNKEIDELDFIIKGGYPFLWVEKNISPNIFYSNYLITYIERDIRSLINIGKVRDFERFIRSLAIRVGQLLNFSDLARDVGISVSTAREWTSILEASNQLFLMEPYFRNIGKRIIKSPKIYFTDTGFLCYLLGIESKDDLLNSIYLGNIWENFIINEVLKLFSFNLIKPTVWFFRDKDALEVDLIIELNGKINIYDIKFTENPDKNDIKSIKKTISFFDEKQINKAGIICRTLHEYEIDKNIFGLKINHLKELLEKKL